MKDVDEPRMTAMTSKLSMRELEEFGDRGALLFSAAIDDDALHTLTAALADWHPGKAGARDCRALLRWSRIWLRRVPSAHVRRPCWAGTYGRSAPSCSTSHRR